MGYNLSDPLNQARTGRVLPERDRSSHLVIVGGIAHKNSSKVVCVERDQMVCALASDRSNQAFSKSVLPGRAGLGIQDHRFPVGPNVKSLIPTSLPCGPGGGAPWPRRTGVAIEAHQTFQVWPAQTH